MSKEYIRFSENYKINQLIPLTDSPYKYIKNKNSPYFISMMKYNEDQYKEFQKTKSVAKLSGGKTNKIWADFDSITHLAITFSDAVIFVKDLLNNGVKEEEIQISFSGNKGIGIIVETKNEFTIEQVKSFCFDLLSGLPTFDKTMYDHQRIFRLNFTKNEKTGLYKLPITYEELVDANIEEIKKRAAIDPTSEEIQDVNDYYKVSDFKLPDEYLNVQKLEVVPKEIVIHGEIDWAAKPKFLTNCRYALQNGLFEPGFRSNPLLCLASTYKNLGNNFNMTYRMLKGVAQNEADRNGSERYPDTEIYNNIMLQVFSDRWKNGQFSCKQPGNFLYDYCQTLGKHKCDHTEDTKHIIKIDALATSFEDYAENFEKNIVKTGIAGIDENIMFLTSTLNGILGQPGCHAKDTEILMYDGSIKKIQDIVIGDLVMGPDSKPREVLKLYNGQDEMYEITPIKGEKFIVNQHHILNIKPSIGTNNKAFECNLNIMLKDYINKTSKVVKNRYKVHRKSVEFEKNVTLIDPYIMGIWLGDGTSSKPEITSMDTEIIDSLIQYGDIIGDNVNVVDTPSKAKTIRFTGMHFRIQLGKENVFNNKHVPKNYLINSRENRLEILAGLLDSDGHLDNNRTGFQFMNKNEDLAKSVVFLCRSLGLAAYASLLKKNCLYKGQRREGMYWSVSISGNTDIIPTRLLRKRAKPRKQVKDHLVTGFSYKSIGQGEYFGFTLDKDHLYLTSDFMVHHNSGKTSMVLQWLKNNSELNSKSLFYSLDMGKPIIYAKLIQQTIGCSFKEATEILKNDKKKFLEIKDKVGINFKNVNFNFKSGMQVEHIKDDIKAHEDKTGDKLRLVVIDYLECLAGPYSDSTANTGYISNQMKDLANEMEVCAVMLLQTQKHATSEICDPLLSMRKIKGASVIEQSASVIMTLWREGYNPKTVNEDRYISFAAVKNRFGPLWSDDFKWDGKKGYVSNLEDYDRQLLSEFRSHKAAVKAEEKKDDSGGGWS